MLRRIFQILLVPAIVALLSGCSQNLVVLNPEGPVARSQYNLIVWSFVLLLLIIVVVFVLFAIVIYKYREKPENMGYEPPEQEGNKWLEIVWTAVPVILVIALAIPTVKTNFALEKPPTPDVKPLVIKVTAADWKWIFSYPDQNIETVNYVNIPASVPVQFQLTSTGNMSSFWVPKLGGQEYAMHGMENSLYLQADHPGDYQGRNANFTGTGFAEMTFMVHSLGKDDFDKWVQKTQTDAPKLTKQEYETIIQPGHEAEKTFSSTHLGFEPSQMDHAHMH